MRWEVVTYLSSRQKEAETKMTKREARQSKEKEKKVKVSKREARLNAQKLIQRGDRMVDAWQKVEQEQEQEQVELKVRMRKTKEDANLEYQKPRKVRKK